MQTLCGPPRTSITELFIRATRRLHFTFFMVWCQGQNISDHSVVLHITQELRRKLDQEAYRCRLLGNLDDDDTEEMIGFKFHRESDCTIIFSRYVIFDEAGEMTRLTYSGIYDTGDADDNLRDYSFSPSDWVDFDDSDCDPDPYPIPTTISIDPSIPTYVNYAPEEGIVKYWHDANKNLGIFLKIRTRLSCEFTSFALIVLIFYKHFISLISEPRLCLSVGRSHRLSFIFEYSSTE